MLTSRVGTSTVACGGCLSAALFVWVPNTDVAECNY